MGATTRFLFNQTLWTEVQARVKTGNRVSAAVAYLGDSAADLLPLGKGDRLVVDMSMGAVRQGVTDPHEIKRLVRRGVQVFTRGTLHAKFIIVGNTLIAGSANASNNSLKVLDEAAILTTDPVAIRRARVFFDQLCTEPVREKYVAECIRAYQPPKFKAAARPASGGTRGKRVTQAKLWLLRNLEYGEVPAGEREKIEVAEGRAEQKLKQPEKTHVDTVHYAYRPGFFDSIRPGDWVIQTFSAGRGADVWAPCCVLGFANYPRGGGRRRYLVHFEMPDGVESMPGSEFRRRLRSVDTDLAKPSNRTRAVTDDDVADKILRFWTPAGRVSKKGR